MADKYKRARLDAQMCELETNERGKSEARKDADEPQTQKREQFQKDLQQTKFYLEKGIHLEVWPTEEEFQLAKNKIQYDPEKLHFAVYGSSGSGKFSIINAFPTGVDETIFAITRYPEPRKERLVWFDRPRGLPEIPG